MHVTDIKILPASRLLFPATIGGVDPVLPEGIPDGPLPGRFLDLGARDTIVQPEIMIVVNRIDAGGRGKASPLGPGLATVITIMIRQQMGRVIDVDVVTEHQEGGRS